MIKIAIIDYGMGNLRSVEKAFHKVGAEGAFVTDDPAAIAAADKAVLPGDGSFDVTLARLRESGIADVAQEFAASGRPFLGICVGMQALLTGSEEGEPGVVGLNLVPGCVRKFEATATQKVPQIGWNQLRFPSESPLFAGIAQDSYVYFLHSFYCVPDDKAAITATCDYGVDYCAGLQRKNVYATQFHPEKSGDVGLRILRNFTAIM